MIEICVEGIPETIAADVRATMHSPGYGHPAHRERAQGYGPCRSCLRTFAVGQEERILFTYQPFQEDGSLPAPGPVFIHADRCPRYHASELPPDFLSLPLVYEAYAPGGRLISQQRVGDRDAGTVLRELLGADGVEYVHIRNGKVGCFMARAHR